MRDKFQAAIDKKRAVKEAEKCGVVADSMDVRMALMERVRAKEITLEQAQAELSKIKRSAKSNGMTTRSKVFHEG